MIEEINSGRNFYVREAGHISGQHDQAISISQGYPLSPFLFSNVMIVLLHDARANVQRKGFNFPSDICREILYADDTVCMSTDPRTLTFFLQVIEAVGE